MRTRSIGAGGVALAALLSWTSTAAPQAWASEVRLTADYAAVAVEAEAHGGGIHIGLDGRWPDSGASLQVCDAAVSARQPDANVGNDAARLDVDVRKAPGRTRLATSLGGLPGVIEPGRPGSLSFSVANTGDVPAREARVSLELPAGFDVVSTSAECRPSARRVLCRIGTLDAGRTRTLAATVATAVAGGYAIGAAASARNADDSNAASSLSVIAP